VDLTQEVNLENRGAFVPEVIEQSFDKLTQIAQDHQEQLDRSIKVDKFDVADLDQLVSDITTLAAIDTDISTVAGVSSEVTTVAGIAADVTTAATNVADITNFADVYIGASATDPATRSDGSALQAGDLYFNTTSDLMYVYDGAAWQAAYASTAGLLTAANNLSDLTDADAALVNLGNPDQLARIPSKADATIAKGAVVYATGAVGSSGKITIDNYIADGSVDELYVIGIADRALATNGEGFTLHFGELTGVSTDGSSAAGTETWTAGTVLYADPANAGKLTNVEPTAPNLAIPLAMVLVAHASNGIMFVRPRLGNHLTELHDVVISGTPADNELLAYDTTTGTWINQTAAEAGVLTGITGQSIKNLSDVYSSMAPTDGQVLTYDTTNGWQAEDGGASTTYGDVGTYGLFFWVGSVQNGPGTTVAGSSLYPCDGYGYQTAGYSSAYGQPSGTWQLMGVTGYNNNVATNRDDFRTSVFVRIS
jgi:hypothetical protein